ncbi:MAG: MarR family transcriptional regulator [Planctomycetota bacterium]
MTDRPAFDAAGLTIAVDPRYDLQTLRALRRIVRAIDLHSHRLYEVHRITTPQLVCLLTIKEHEPIVQRDLAAQVHLSPSTMVGILDRLEDRGLVRRRRDARDRRLMYISLTPAGRELVTAAPSPLQDRLAAALKLLPESEQRAITAALNRVVDLMEVSHLDAAPMLETGALDATGRRTPPAGVAPAPLASTAPTAPAEPAMSAAPVAAEPIENLPSASNAPETQGEPPRGPQGLTDGAAMARPDPPPPPQANDSRP